ncbi:MAG: zinc-ribbon domain containing protein [Bacillota bacterium]|jgi:CxxC-x17-CxxC domain-containing protein
MYTDKTLTCRDCGKEFTFTAGEQEFYASRGFQNEPSRCPECRAARKAQNGGGSRMGGPRQPREMHTVICAECGKETQVPFKPSGDRPVYCQDCFQSRRARW